MTASRSRPGDPMDVTVRPAVDSDIPALHGLHAAQNDFGGRWFTNPFTGGKEVSFEDLNPAQRWLHGGPWMDPQLLSLHIRRYADAGGAVLVAERAETIVGSIELWLSEEPLPFGRYLDVEMLIPYPPPPSISPPSFRGGASRSSRDSGSSSSPNIGRSISRRTAGRRRRTIRS